MLLEHRAGLVCAAQDVEALAAAMSDLLAADRRADFGARARVAVLPLTPAAMAAELLALYRTLLAEGRAGRTL
jgi:glycosyltransferase involved in cell wall biosynthesis